MAPQPQGNATLAVRTAESKLAAHPNLGLRAIEILAATRMHSDARRPADGRVLGT